MEHYRTRSPTIARRWGPRRPHKERKDTGEDGYVQIFIRFSSFGSEPNQFMLVSYEKREKNIDGGKLPPYPCGDYCRRPEGRPAAAFITIFPNRSLPLPCPARDASGQRVLKDILRACVFHRSGV